MELWLRLEAIRWRGRQLWILADLGGHPVSTTLWYGDVDLDALARAIGAEAMERLAFHIAAFELNKLCSLAPTHLSFGPFARFVTSRFVELWSTVFHNVWAQWRYEHDRPDFRQMIGLGEHTPFECIGEVAEARLALALCAARGRHGRAVGLYCDSGFALDVPAVLRAYAKVHTASPHGIPEAIAQQVLPPMLRAERRAGERIATTLAAARQRR